MADAGYKLTVEGEKEFKKALSEINDQIKVSKTEIRALTEEYKLNDAGVGKLQDKQEALERTMEQQREKVKLVSEQYEKARAVYGDTDSSVLKLEESMNKAREELAKTTQQWEKNTEEIRKLEEQAESLMSTENELAKSIQEIDSELKVNESQLKLINTQYKNSENAAEGLEEKNKVLTDSMQKQQEKLEKLTKTLQKAEEEYGQQSKEVAEYRTQINETKTKIEEITQEIKENNDALEETGKTKLDGLSDGLSDILDKVGIELPDGIEEVIGGFDGATLAAGGIVTVIAGAIGKMTELRNETMEWADSLTTSSQMIGLTTEEYQALEYAATKLGVPMDVLLDAFKEINKKAGESHEILGEYVDGTKSLVGMTEEEAKAFNAAREEWNELGVALYDQHGNLKETRELFNEIIDAFSKMPDGAEKSKKMMDLFGDSAYRLNPIVSAGVDMLKQYEEEAYKMGVVLSENTVKGMDDMKNASETWSSRIEAAFRRVGVAWSQYGIEDIFSKSIFRDVLLKPFFNIGGEYTANVPSYATGTLNHPGGLALVGERGPELVRMPAGSQVIPNGEFSVGGSVVNQTVNVYVDHVQSMKEIERIAEGQRANIRMGYVRG